MLQLTKKYNIIVKFEKLPEPILGIYLNVFDKPHILLNNLLHEDMYEFMFYSCLSFRDIGIGKITLEDMQNTELEAFKFARLQMGK